MERKFKVGDRVSATTMIVGEIVYINPVDVEKPYLVQWYDGGNMFFEEKILDLHTPKKLPEPKFNPYDKVRVNIKNFTTFNAEVTAWFICGDHYIYELKTEDGGTIQSKGEGLELIEPKYKKGDKVWNKRDKTIDFFHRYNSYNYKACLLRKAISMPISDIEPYTGQDKAKEETLSPEKVQELINEMCKQPLRIIPLHPYTVILKSGVKVGVTSTMADYINEQGDDTTSVETVEDGSFILSEIAAIVPTENILK